MRAKMPGQLNRRRAHRAGRALISTLPCAEAWPDAQKIQRRRAAKRQSGRFAVKTNQAVYATAPSCGMPFILGVTAHAGVAERKTPHPHLESVDRRPTDSTTPANPEPKIGCLAEI